MLKQLFAVILLFAATSAPQQAQVAAPPAPGASPQAVRRIRVSGNVMSAKLLRKVAPVYPPLATMARIQGTVRMSVVIGTDGRLLSLKVISGHPFLVKSALDAVQQWRYQPTLLNGKPVEVQTEIDVIFTLSPQPAALFFVPTAKEQAAELSSEQARMASVDPQTLADVRQLFELTGIRSVMQRVFSVMFVPIKAQLVNSLAADPKGQQIAGQFVIKMNERANSDADFYNLLAAVYAKHFTDAEVKQAIVFYESPVGRKLSGTDTSLQQEFAAVVMARWKIIVFPQIVSELANEFPEIKQRMQSSAPSPGSHP